MVVSRVLCCSVLVAVLTAVVTQASIELVEEANFTVRGLSEQIEQIKFNDIDGDGFPEVLASDGQDIVLYSVTGDSVVFASSLDSDYLAWPVNHRIEFADVNRDSAADVVVGYYSFESDRLDFDFTTLIYDGAHGFQLADSVYAQLEPYMMLGPFCYPGLTALQALDIDKDGYNELLVSFDSSEGWTDWQLTVGSTHLYHSFPDSLRWQQDYVVYNVKPFVSDSTGDYYITTEFFYHEVDMPGIDISRTEVRPVLIKPDGSKKRIKLLDDASRETNSITKSSHVCRLGCFGELIDKTSPLELILTYQFRSEYTEYTPDSIIHQSNQSSEQAMYSFSTVSTADLVWSDDHFYYRYYYHPEFPGFYFTMSDHTLTQHRGTDGSVNQTFDNLPDGLKDWVYPYGDEQSRLVVSNGNQVSLYRMDIVTGIADGRDSPALPELFELGQPYPNPFNAQVTIPVTMLRAGRLRVDVFNLLGRKVATVYDGPASVGQRDCHWDAEEYASGVYLFKATTNGETATIKATLLK